MAHPSERELAVFSAARQMPAGERGAFLDTACAGDPALRQRIQELLQASEAAGDFLNSPAPGLPGPEKASRSERCASEKVGDRIGHYKLLQQVQLWDLRLLRQELTQLHLDWDMPPYPPAGKTTGASPVTLEVEPDPARLDAVQSETNSAARFDGRGPGR